MDRVKKCGVEGNRMQDLHIEVRDQDIVVTMPGTSLRVVYRKPHRGRSGGRSLAAAKAMAEAGYRACHNVAGGFEGPLDDDRHRGSAGGWKATGLPRRAPPVRL